MKILVIVLAVIIVIMAILFFVLEPSPRSEMNIPKTSLYESQYMNQAVAVETQSFNLIL
ncbi:MAG TPA: hypothetical protein PKA42_02655 [Candidatus Paceibacterota bacterium]|nr:hypothetical protein [Candidatus Paceibacterota bacterium]